MFRGFRRNAGGGLGRRIVPIWLMATLAAVVTGPFGTFEALGWAERTFYWGTVIGLAIAVAFAVCKSIAHLWPALPERRTKLLATAAFAPIFAILLWALNGVWAGSEAPQTISFVALLFFVLLISSAISALVLLFRTSAPASKPQQEPAGDTGPPLLQRLPAAVRGQILHLCASDHYVQVYTDNGSTRLLMRFSDALAELGTLDGMRVHRSYWVLNEAVSGLRRGGGRLHVVLKTGREVPVSRTYQARVETAFADRPRLNPPAPASE